MRAARGERVESFEMDWHLPDGVRSLLVSTDTVPAAFGHGDTIVSGLRGRHRAEDRPARGGAPGGGERAPLRGRAGGPGSLGRGARPARRDLPDRPGRPGLSRPRAALRPGQPRPGRDGRDRRFRPPRPRGSRGRARGRRGAHGDASDGDGDAARRSWAADVLAARRAERPAAAATSWSALPRSRRRGCRESASG